MNAAPTAPPPVTEDQVIKAFCLVGRLVDEHCPGLKQLYKKEYADVRYSRKSWIHFVTIPSVVSLVRQMVTALSEADIEILLDAKPAVQKEKRGGLYPSQAKINSEPLLVVHYAGDEHGRHLPNDVGRPFARLATYHIFVHLFPELADPVSLLLGRWYSIRRLCSGTEEAAL